MDREIQIDLARPEAPADQAVGAVSESLGPNSNPSRLQPEPQRHFENLARSSRGASVGSASLNWGLNSSRSRSTSPASHDKSMEMGHSNDSTKVFTLHPQDMGFGAWSYVASAFAFYIVVWGERTTTHLSQSSELLLYECSALTEIE